MEKEFVPHELALRMKQLGFDEPCLGFYNKEDRPNLGYCTNSFQDDTTLEIKCTAPLYQQAFRWFREKNFHVNIDSYHSLSKNKPFGLSIDYLHESGKWDYVDYRDDEDFETYEEAQKRAIEIIIEILERKK
jgi:hypothetical protein